MPLYDNEPKPIPIAQEAYHVVEAPAATQPVNPFPLLHAHNQSAPLLTNNLNSNFLESQKRRKCLFKASICLFIVFVVYGIVLSSMFPGIVSFLGDLISLLFVMSFAAFFTAVISINYNKLFATNSSFNPVVCIIGAVFFPLTFGFAMIFISYVATKSMIQKRKPHGQICCTGFILFILTVAAFFGGIFGVWDLLFNRYCLWEPIKFTSETCTPLQNITLPINYQLQARYLQVNGRVIYDAYKTPTNSTTSVGEGNSLAVFGQSQWQRCSAPGAPWTYEDGQSVQMWNPVNASNPYSGQWVHSADRKIIWEATQLLPYSVYNVFNCNNDIQYIITTETDFSTISLYDIKIRDKDSNVLAATKQQFAWTSTSFPFTKDDGELVGTLSQTISYDVWRDHWNVNVKPEYKHYIEPYVYGHVASIVKRTQGSHSSRRRSSGSRRRSRRRRL
jgi:hypothetical protein